MGRRLIALGTQDPELQVVAGLESPDHPQIGRDAAELAGLGSAGIPLLAELPDGVQAVIDFSVPEAATALATACAQRAIALVLATTGMTDQQQAAIHAAAERIPVVWAPSMSLAVNLTMKLCQQAAAALRDLPSGVDVEIIERHHRFKVDAPSGTALRFGELIADVMGQTQQVHGREGTVGERPRNEIGYHAVRVGDNPGEHTIVFGMLGETLELKVAASNRDCYASGALMAAKFVAGRPPGIYSMFDVLEASAQL